MRRMPLEPGKERPQQQLCSHRCWFACHSSSRLLLLVIKLVSPSFQVGEFFFLPSLTCYFLFVPKQIKQCPFSSINPIPLSWVEPATIKEESTRFFLIVLSLTTFFFFILEQYCHCSSYNWQGSFQICGIIGFRVQLLGPTLSLIDIWVKVGY